MNGYEGPERREPTRLSQEQINVIAERAAEVAIERVYTAIGKSVVKKFFWLVGAASLAVAAWLIGSGRLKL